jgi:hypothetical protein
MITNRNYDGHTLRALAEAGLKIRISAPDEANSAAAVQKIVEALAIFARTWPPSVSRWMTVTLQALPTSSRTLDPFRPGKPAQREIDIEPSYVIESSPGNFQRIYFFDKPLTAIEAKPVPT